MDIPMKRVPARFLDTGEGPGAWNMALDEILLEDCKARLAAGRPPESAPVTLRVYAWSPPALSLGRSQRARRDVRLGLLAEEGVDLCRRLTGGRAVLHEAELTYALVGPAAILGRTVEESYRRLSAGVAEGLRRLGARVEFGPPGGGGYASQPSCFATTSVHEISIGGRKVVGSAQCRAGGALLQHGSVLLRSPEARLARLLRPRGREREEERREGDAAGPSGNGLAGGHAVGLCEALGREVSFGEAARALREGLEEAGGFVFGEEPLRPDERARAEALAAGRYADPEWTLMR
ncbi:MAG: lipoate--protein ligase family protein [bacterium]